MSELSFKDLELSENILEALDKKGYKTPSPIQAGVIPIVLTTDKDIIGQAKTGTGKTAAFGLPLLEKIDLKNPATQAIILAPTRELAMQVYNELTSFSVKNSPRMTVIYGGQNLGKEERELRQKPHIVIGTPGRVMHHLRKRTLKIQDIDYFILDEADEMLNYGFREDIERILESTPAEKRVLLFSATMPKPILNIVSQYMGDYETIKIKAEEMTNNNITQQYYAIPYDQKFDALCRMIEMEDDFYAIVFCRTKMDVDLVSSQLSAKLYHAEAIHGDIEQNQREKTLKRFRERKINILVATDVAARGIDIKELNHVINYSLPENHEIYTHRIGRTGRAGNKGFATSFVERKDVNKIRMFQRQIGTKIVHKRLPEPAEIVAKKQAHLLSQVAEIIQLEDLDYLRKIAEKLLGLGDPALILAAVIKETYKDGFDVKAYQRIREFSPGDVSDSRGGGRSRGFGGRERSGRYRGGRSRGGSRDRDRKNGSRDSGKYRGGRDGERRSSGSRDNNRRSSFGRDR